MIDTSESAGEKLEKVANTTDLQTAITRLENLRGLQEASLKAEYHTLLNELKPKNILKNTIAEVRESTPVKHNLLKLALGLGAGYFSRKLIVDKSAGVVKKALGAALQYCITHFVARKNDGDDDRPHSKNIFQRIFGKK